MHVINHKERQILTLTFTKDQSFQHWSFLRMECFRFTINRNTILSDNLPPLIISLKRQLADYRNAKTKSMHAGKIFTVNKTNNWRTYTSLNDHCLVWKPQKQYLSENNDERRYAFMHRLVLRPFQNLQKWPLNHTNRDQRVVGSYCLKPGFYELLGQRIFAITRLSQRSSADRRPRIA